MSFSLEPQTSAKCIVHTSKGNLSIELWAKECPITARIFLQHCLDDRYNGLKLSTMVGDSALILGNLDINNDTNSGANSVVPEVNSRMNFQREGYLGWDIQRNTWFITTKEWDTNNKNVLGKLVDQSIYVFRDICSGATVQTDPTTFLYPAEVSHVEVTIPYFDDLKRSCPETKNIKQARESTTHLKQKRLDKVLVSYNDDEEDDGQLHEDIFLSQKPEPKKKRIKLPVNVIHINDNTVDIVESDKSGAHIAQQDVSPNFASMINDDGAGSSVITHLFLKNEELNDKETQQSKEQTAREIETMRIFEEFQNQVKGERLLNRSKH